MSAAVTLHESMEGDAPATARGDAPTDTIITPTTDAITASGSAVATVANRRGHARWREKAGTGAPRP